MSNTIIKVENLSKQYRLGQVGTGSLSHDINRLWHKVRGNEDPYLKIGEENKRESKGNSDYVWALKDINFDIQQGDRVGIIGRNGAGKSTLLKILSRTTSPTTGSVKIKGRVASLLEVGTGFHPDLSGRDNIFLNGAILGMSKRDIKSRFDEIVDFAGVERYIDTPVKRYSSGMYVRLAFAVAAHLESDILIVDEVLAVGDAEFQKKCLRKMGDMSKGEGRTILFVSHNMTAIQKLCSNGLLLANGSILDNSNVNHIISKYLESNKVGQAIFKIPVPASLLDLKGFAYQLQIEDIEGNLVTEIPVGKAWQIRVQFKLLTPVKHFIIALGITNSMEINIRTTWSNNSNLDKGEYEVVFKEEHLLLATGLYYLTVGLSSFERSIQYLENIAAMSISIVNDRSLDKTILRTSGVGLILNPMNVKVSSATKI
jgi:lipopolysaccharide transport system ATP-binding protein